MSSQALEKLCKWRLLLAGWHKGTDAIAAPGTQAMRDLMEKWLLMRVENNAIVALLVKKGVFTADEFRAAIDREAVQYDRDMERVFPGFRTTLYGVEIFDTQIAAETMRQKGFPP